MLYPHSLLWHYLWVGTDVLLLVLALLTWRRQLYRLFPAFFVYMVFEGIQGLTLYVMDLAPRVSADVFWRAEIAIIMMEAIVKLAVIREIFSNLVRPRPSVARTGKYLIVCAVVVLVAVAAVAAAYAPTVLSQAPSSARLVLHYQVLEQAIYLVEAGLLLFIYLFAAHHHLIWSGQQHGIALGLSISACVGLGVFAISANRIVFPGLRYLDFFNMTTYHICVLIWFYYLLSLAHPAPPSIDNRVSAERNKRAGSPNWAKA
ncbi:MAG: hypothetical protein WAN65_24855 [Candidatus Sulfotelmatobacter sp.]